MSARRASVRGGGPLGWLGALVLVYLAVPVVAFLVRLAGTSRTGFSAPGVFPALWVSVAGASISTVLIAVFGIPLAWALAHSRSRLATLIGTLVYLPLAVPPLISGVLLIYLVGPYTWLGRTFDRRLTDSLAGVVIAQTFVAAPFLVVSARAAFSAVDPALEESAAALGHHPVARMFRVGLPAAQAGIRAGLLLAWLRAFGEYGATVLVAYHPSSLPVYTYIQFSATGLDDTAAPTALAFVVAAVAVTAGRLRLPRSRSVPAVPDPRRPPASDPAPVRFDLDVRVGTFRLRAAHAAATHRLALLGPSGSGKSLTLRSLAGLLGPGAGEVGYGGEAVSAVPVEDRNVGYVPQGYHLLPHLDVWRQVTFGVGADPALAAYWLEALGISDLTRRRPDELSGGQRQRVCLAQALARRPRLLLLDEPFSALDTPVRAELGRQLRRLQHEAGLSTVLVTHDPAEAALLADEILVVLDGRVVQAGEPAEVLNRPATPEVGRLVGMVNVVDGRIGPGPVLTSGALSLPLPRGTRWVPGTTVRWGIHPEHVRLGGAQGQPAVVTDVVALGPLSMVEVIIGTGPRLTARIPAPCPWLAGQACTVSADVEAVVVWPDPPGAASAAGARPGDGGVVGAEVRGDDSRVG